MKRATHTKSRKTGTHQACSPWWIGSSRSSASETRMGGVALKKIQESVTAKRDRKRRAHLIRRSHPFAAFGSFLSVETEAFAAFCVAELAVTPSRQALLGIQSLTYDGRTHLRCHFGTRTWHFHHWVRVEGVGPPIYNAIIDQDTPALAALDD